MPIFQEYENAWWNKRYLVLGVVVAFSLFTCGVFIDFYITRSNVVVSFYMLLSRVVYLSFIYKLMATVVFSYVVMIVALSVTTPSVFGRLTARYFNCFYACLVLLHLGVML
jgi:hypothetical protein